MKTQFTIYSQIIEYTHWKAERHPHIAGAHKSLLCRIVEKNKFHDVSDIQIEHIAFFTGEELSRYFTDEALRAIRGFLWYCRRAGYPCISWQQVTKENMTKTMGRPVQWDMVKEVKELQEKGRGVREMSKELSKKYNTKVYPTSVQRWKQYIPKLGKLSTDEV